MPLISRSPVYLTFWMCLYGVGVGVSQSLMSLAATFIALLGLITSFRETFVHKVNIFKIAPEVPVIFTLVIYLLLNISLHPFDPRATHEALKWAPLFFVLLATGNTAPIILGENQKKILYLITVLSLWISCFFGLYQFIVSGGSPAVSFFRNPIYLAYNLFPAFLFFSESFFSKSTDWKKTNLLTVLLLGLTLLATLNRFVPFCIGIYFLTKLFTLKNKQHKLLILSGGLLAIVCFLVLYFTNPVAQEKFGRGISLADLSLRGRLTVWSHNWNIFLENPFFGVGPLRNWVDTAIHTQWSDLWSSGVRIYAHSVYLQALADSGFFGLSLILLSFYFFSRKNPFSLIIFVFVFLIGGLTENILNNSKAFHSLLFYFMLPRILDNSPKANHETI